MESGPSGLFVYGTLKRGQLNHVLVAPYTLSVEPARARGRLYDLGLYPALVEGDGLVEGELLHLRRSDLRKVLALLDRLEGYVPEEPSASMYVRRVVEVIVWDGEPREAYTYYYNRDPEGLPRLESAEWTGPSPEAASGDDTGDPFAAHVRTFRDTVRE